MLPLESLIWHSLSKVVRLNTARCSLSLVLVVLSHACTQEIVAEESLIERLELVYAAKDGDGVAIGGLAKSVESFATVVVSNPEGDVVTSTQADEVGRFFVRSSAYTDSKVMVQVNAEDPVEFRVRELGTAIDQAVRVSVNGLGYVPNDLLVIEDNNELFAVIVRSGDNAVSRISLDSGVSTGVPLPDLMGVNGSRIPAVPWFVAQDVEQKVFVTASGQNRVYWLDLENQQILGVLESDTSVVLEEDFALQRPYDTNGDGILETKISTFKPRFPQGLLVTDDVLIVGYSGFISPRLDASRPAVYVPGVIKIWNRRDLSQEPTQIVLPYMNPQEVSFASDGKVIATCSGIIETSNGMTGLATQSGIAFIDIATKTIVETVDLGEFGASSTIDAGGQIWTASLLKGQIINLRTKDVIVLTDQAVDSVFRLTQLPGNLVAAPSFNTDKLFIFDATTGQINPAPFVKPFSVGPGPPVIDGAQIIARRAGRAGVDYTGPDLFVLSGLASRLWSVETRKLLGP